MSTNFYKSILSQFANLKINATIYTRFTFATLFFYNVINSNTSLPYYFINFYLIYSILIFSLLTQNSKKNKFL